MGDKIKIIDDCLHPWSKINMTYKGKNPVTVIQGIEDVFKPYFRISTSKYNQEVFNWDVSGKVYEFFFKYWIEKEVSGYTKLKFRIWVQGTEDSETHEGEAKIEITAHAEHTFPGHWILKGFWWLYQYLFYDKLRSQYIDKCRELSEGLKEIFKERFGLETTPAKIPERFPKEDL